MTDNIHHLTGRDELDDGDKLVAEQRALMKRMKAATRDMRTGQMDPADATQLASELEDHERRMLEYIEREQRQMASLRRMGKAMRPGENLQQFIEWGKAQGFTTVPQIVDARESAKGEAS
jgi:hypothetical protein